MNELVQAARSMRERAWAPYSGFAVGAAVRSAGGRVHLGCNVENAAYPEGLCAEAAAIAAMVAAGDREIIEIAVAGSGEAPCAPCGGCRQRIAEFAAPDAVVHMTGSGGTTDSVPFAELLPRAFGPRALGIAPPATTSSAADVVRERTSGFAPLVALQLGSGLAPVEQRITEAITVRYDELPGLPRPGVPGHAGRLVLGRLGGVPVACLCGRVHLYEGQPAHAVLPFVQLVADLGCRVLLLTNAAGSLRPQVGPGRLVRIVDHINLQGSNPLVGIAGTGGPPFLDLSQVYDAEIGELIDATAARLGIPLDSGVYLATLGPCFETPAEIRAFRVLGADLVGMSTVPEAVAARHLGLRLAGLSVVTNLAAGLAPAALSHAQTLDAARAAADELGRLLEAVLPEIADRVD